MQLDSNLFEDALLGPRCINLHNCKEPSSQRRSHDATWKLVKNRSWGTQCLATVRRRTCTKKTLSCSAIVGRSVAKTPLYTESSHLRYDDAVEARKLLKEMRPLPPLKGRMLEDWQPHFECSPPPGKKK